jgi:hypothetical protein
MFMSIQMRRAKTRRANFFNLRVPLDFHFFGIQISCRQPEEQGFRATGKFAAFACQVFHFFRRGNGLPVAQIQMHSHSQPRQFAGGLDSIIERAAVGKQGSAGYNSVAVSLGDSAVDAYCPAQVVGIDDQILHPAYARSCPLVQLPDSQTVLFRTIDLLFLQL